MLTLIFSKMLYIKTRSPSRVKTYPNKPIQNKLRIQIVQLNFEFFIFPQLWNLLHFTLKNRNTRPTYIHCFVKKKSFSKLWKRINFWMNFTRDEIYSNTTKTRINHSCYYHSSVVIIIHERTKRLKSENPPR